MTVTGRTPERSALSDLPRQLLELVLVGLLVGLAYSPLAEAGWVGEDWQTLEAAAELAGLGPESSLLMREPLALYRVPGTDARPLAALSISISTRLFGDGGHLDPRQAGLLRLENLILLLLAAFGARRLIRRGLQQWTGTEQASAAGRAAFLLLVVHPIAVSSVAHVGARGELLALALATGACALFLRGRQRGEPGRMLLALLATFLASASSRHVWFLPLALAGLEYTSTRRHRPRRMRLRTSLTTLVVFGAVVVLEEIGRGAVVGFPATVWGALTEGQAAAAGEAWTMQAGVPPVDVVVMCAEKLGLLLLPVNTEGIVAVLGYGIAAMFLVLALHPAFVAARSAPRLWGRILIWWLLVVLLALLPEAKTRVVPSELTRVDVLLTATLLMAVGLGIASTALSGLHRTLLPTVLGVLYAGLAHAAAKPWPDAGARLEELRSELTASARSHPGAHLVVVDLPRTVRGLVAFEPALGSLLAPVFDFENRLTGTQEPVSVRSVGLDGFFALLRQPEASRLRREGWVLLLPRRLVSASEDSGYLGLRLPPPAEASARSFWRSEGRSPAGTSFDPLLSRTVRVKAKPGTTPETEPRVRWLPRSELFESHERRGAWIAGGDGPAACFYLGRDLTWLLGEHVSSLWFLAPLTSITSCEVTSEPEAIVPAGPPRIEGGSWVFDLAGWDRPRALGGEGYWLMGVFDLSTWNYLELSAVLQSDTRLEVPTAANEIEQFLSNSTGPFAWSLEWRVAGVTLARIEERMTVAELPTPIR